MLHVLQMNRSKAPFINFKILSRRVYKMRGKKILAFIVALGAAMAFFAGCSGGSTSSSQSSSESSETSKAESSSAKS